MRVTLYTFKDGKKLAEKGDEVFYAMDTNEIDVSYRYQFTVSDSYVVEGQFRNFKVIEGHDAIFSEVKAYKCHKCGKECTEPRLIGVYPGKETCEECYQNWNIISKD